MDEAYKLLIRMNMMRYDMLRYACVHRLLS